MPHLSKREWWVIGVALVYIFSPVDLLPEVLLAPVLGPFAFADDLGAVALVLTTLVQAWNRERHQPAEATATAKGDVVKGEVIPPPE